MSKIALYFGRMLKPRIPISAQKLENQFEDQKQSIANAALKQVIHAHTIEQLIELFQDVHKYSNISDSIIKRMEKIKVEETELEKYKDQVENIMKTTTNKQLLLSYLNHYHNQNIELHLLEAFRNGSLQVDQQTSLRMFEIICQFGNQDDIDQWSEKYSEFVINAKAIQKFYKLLNKTQLQLKNQRELLQEIESKIHKYTHILEFDDIELILRHRTFHSKALNELLLENIVQRLITIELKLDEILSINRMLFQELNYFNISWIQYSLRNVTNCLNKKKGEIKATQDQQDNMTQELELEPKIIGEFEYQLIDLMDSYSFIFITDNMNQLILSYYQDIDGYIMPYFNQLKAYQQLICYRFHSKLIETYYNEMTHKNQKTYKKSSKKRLELMNNQYYEITIDYLKPLNFQQSLQLLEYASVLGLSKRKVCQKILNIGLEGLEKEKQYTSIDELNYALLSYYKLMKNFITKTDELIKIEDTFKKIQVDTLKLEVDLGHMAINRDKLLGVQQQQ